MCLLSNLHWFLDWHISDSSHVGSQWGSAGKLVLIPLDAQLVEVSVGWKCASLVVVDL